MLVFEGVSKNKWTGGCAYQNSYLIVLKTIKVSTDG
jgi:hypothetical protein